MTEAAGINIDDTTLVQWSQQGNSAAMEKLVLKYQDRIYNAVLRICANTDDAAELTQETFVKIIENIDGFHGRSSFYTWAFRIAVNLTLNYCKRRARLRLRSLDAASDEHSLHTGMALKQLLQSDNAGDPAAIAVNSELCELTGRALMGLDEAQRTVLVLRDIEGMSYAHIAEVLSLELGTVKSRISRARGNLREILEGMSQ